METVIWMIDVSRVVADEMVDVERKTPLPLFPYLGPALQYRAKRFFSQSGKVFSGLSYGFKNLVTHGSRTA